MPTSAVLEPTETRMAEELAKPEVDVMIAAKLGEVAAKGDASPWLPCGAGP